MCCAISCRFPTTVYIHAWAFIQLHIPTNKTFFPTFMIHTDRVYSATVITDPPSGPHLIGSTVNLTCLIHPQPPEEGVTYRWRDYIQYTSPAVANFSLPYATLTIGTGHPQTARYFCQVYYRNMLLVTGHTVLTVQGKLHDCWQYMQTMIQVQPHQQLFITYHFCVCRFAVSNWTNFCVLYTPRNGHLASERHINNNLHQGLPASPHMVLQWG